MPLIRLENFQQLTAINVLSDPGAIGGPVIVPSTAQIKLHFFLDDGKIGHMVLYGQYQGPFAGTVAQANSIMTALSTGGAWTALAAFFATITQFAQVSIKDVNTPGGVEIASSNAAVPGTSASPALPAEVAVVVTFRTALAGAGHRGRMYVPGWATNSLGAGNVVAAGAVTALTNWAATIPSAFLASGYTHGLGLPARAQYTGSTGTVHPARAAHFEPITSRVVRDNHWDSQRRRGLK